MNISRSKILIAAGGLVAVILTGLGFWLGPVAFTSPRVVRTTPADGEQAANPRAEIQITLSQPVQAGALSGITLDPAAPFTTSVDGATVKLVVKDGLAYHAKYRLTIAGLRNQFGRTLDAPVTINFATVPYAAVQEFTPANDTNEIGLRGPITVAFAAPVVSAEQVAAAAEDPRTADGLPQPLVVAPDTKPDQVTPGIGRWLSPTLFGFYPSEDLHAATVYRVTVRADLSSDGLARLEQPVSWDFRTAAPLLVGTRPFNDQQDVAPSAAIEIRLASDVDLRAAGDAFTLKPKDGGNSIAGSVKAAGDGFIFTPNTPLAHDTRYVATLAAGILSKSGTPLNTDPTIWEFNTIGDPEVLQVEPLPDSQDVIVATRRISVRFNHPIVALTDPDSQSKLPNPITITPALQGVGLWIDTSTFVFSPTVGLDPSTTYNIVVAAGLQDATGGTLQQAYRWGFSTLQPEVLNFFPSGSDEPPTSTLQLEFNQAMDVGAVQSGIRVNAEDGAAIAGQFQLKGTLVTFTPSSPLVRGTTYKATVPAGLAPAKGTGGLKQEYTATFRVAPLPILLGSEPRNGSTNASANGSVELDFSTEMNWETLKEHITIDPKPAEVIVSGYDTRVYLYFNVKAETDYRISIDGAATDRFGVAIGTENSISFRTAALDPSLAVLGTGSRIGAYDANRAIRIPLQVVNLEQVGYRLQRIDPEKAAALAGDYESWSSYEIGAAAALREASLPTPGARNQPRISLLELGKLDAGLYVLEVIAGDLTDRQLLVVSPYALTVKRSSDQAFVWAIDLATGKPVSNLELQAATFDYQNQKLTTPQNLGRTGSDGILQTALTSTDLYGTMYLWSPGAQPAAFITTDWNNGINPWDFNLASDYYSSNLYGSINTERPIYRPDQMVHIRGVLRVRELNGQTGTEGYRTPANETGTLIVSDPDGNTVLTRTLTLSEFGTFNTDLPLAASTPLGSYSMIASLDSIPASTVYGSFSVAEYRKPTFEIAVTPSASDVVQGDTLSAAVSAHYFAGGVLGNAPVRWRIMAAPLSFTPEALSEYRFDDIDDADSWYYGDQNSNGSSLIADGSGTTDAQGQFKLSLPADVYNRATDVQGGNNAGGRVLTIEMEVSDVDGQVITAQGQVQVHPAALYIGLRPAGYVVKTGEVQKIGLLSVNLQGDSVPNRVVSVDIFQRDWYSVRERDTSGQLYWTSRYTDTLVQNLPATTDAQGRGEVSFSPAKSGSYRIVASSKDDAGKIAQSSAFTWVYGGDVFWGIDDTNRVDLIADKRSYRPGETAKILVTAPYAGMTALVTLERAEVLEHRQITLTGTSEVLEVPITAEHAPNVFVSVVMLKTPCANPANGQNPCPEVADLRVGLANLIVSTEQQELNISVTPDKQQAGPHDAITYTIKATDYSGAGVRTELGLALVDKAVLTLADDPNPSLRNAFYSQRGLGVMTSQSLTALVERVTAKLQAGDKGGGGAEGDLSTRRDFPDTAYWNPAVVTGADGTASVTVTLPDSLTTWRMTARGVSVDTRVGQGTSDIIATKPLFVRPALPRFLTAGDAPALQAVVQNGTNAAIDTTVTIEILSDQAKVLELDGPASQTLQVASGAASIVRWPAKVAGNAPGGSVTVRITVTGGNESDAVEVAVPIQRYETPEVAASAGQVLDQTVETIQPPAGDGQLDLELVPSLASGIYTGLDALQAFPYDCTEQTVGKFLPNAVTYRLLKQAGRDDPALRSTLEQSLAAGSQRLAVLQNLDGGWGWWEGNESNPFITAYVVQGLVEAQKAGLSVDARLLNGGLDFIERALNDDTLAIGKRQGNEDVRAYTLFVLGEAGRPDRARSVTLFEQRTGLQTYGRAYLLMALQSVGGEDARVRSLVNELMNRAVLTTTEAHWEEARIDYWAMSSNTRSTALALQALVRADPQNFLVPNAVRYLMSQREHGTWQTTQETAISTIGLAEYVAASGELKADYQYKVGLAGQILKEGQVNAQNLADPIRVALTLADLKVPAGGQAQIAISKQGAGRLYYTLRLRSFADAGAVQALDRGMNIEREYIAVASDTLSPTGQLVNNAKLGDVVQVRLTIHLPSDMEYLIIEDHLPAGLEALDASLKTTASAAQDQGLSDSEGYPGWWYFTRTEVRDTRVALFATELQSGTYTYTYLARATTPGVFQTLPALGYQMYAPEVFGRSNGARFEVKLP